MLQAFFQFQKVLRVAKISFRQNFFIILDAITQIMLLNVLKVECLPKTLLPLVSTLMMGINVTTIKGFLINVKILLHFLSL
jgi:hypothetical protein